MLMWLYLGSNTAGVCTCYTWGMRKGRKEEENLWKDMGVGVMSKNFRTPGPLNRQQENRSTQDSMEEPRYFCRFWKMLASIFLLLDVNDTLLAQNAEKEPRNIFGPSHLCRFLCVIETQLITFLFPIWLPSLHYYQNNSPKRLWKATVLETSNCKI